jgi:hypothetical protein
MGREGKQGKREARTGDPERSRELYPVRAKQGEAEAETKDTKREPGALTIERRAE